MSRLTSEVMLKMKGSKSQLWRAILYMRTKGLWYGYTGVYGYTDLDLQQVMRRVETLAST